MEEKESGDLTPSSPVPCEMSKERENSRKRGWPLLHWILPFSLEEDGSRRTLAAGFFRMRFVLFLSYWGWGYKLTG
jgi:hypothetical protein